MKKSISLSGVFSIATGAMISSGLFILPGLAYVKTGPAVILSYFIAGLIALLGILSAIELSTAMPKVGGDYYFIQRTLGPVAGTVSGLLGWIALSLKSAFAVFGIAEIILVLTGLPVLVSSAILCAIFVLLNIIGVKEAVGFQIMMVIGLLGLLVLYIISGATKIELTRYTPFFSQGFNSVLITAGFIFISFGGLLNVVNIAEEVENPKRNIPLGMISSLLVVTLLYTCVVLVITGTLTPEAFMKSLTPVADSAKQLFGMPGYIIISVAALLAFITTANAGIMSASRYPLAMSQDCLLPEKISRINQKYQTPVSAIVITGVIIYLFLLLPLDIMIKSASTVVLISYVLTNVCVIILRESRIANYQPSFKVPLYPWIQVFGIGLFSFFVIDLGIEAMEVSVFFLILCLGVYFLYGRKHSSGEYALLHLLKKIVDKRLTEHLLENELREIIVSRDEIVHDIFDELVKKAYFIDLEGPLDYPAFIEEISLPLSKHIGIPREQLVKMYLQRQTESNTAISKFCAIPHIVVDEVEDMYLMVARCREGISFSPQEDDVKAVFLFGCNSSKRDVHLKVLASIASLVQNESFSTDWLEANAENNLRDYILLIERRKFH